MYILVFMYEFGHVAHWPVIRKTLHDNIKVLLQEEFEDSKGVIRIRKSKKNRQHNGQKKKYKGQITIYKTYT